MRSVSFFMRTVSFLGWSGSAITVGSTLELCRQNKGDCH
jgi:hypothetical protein